MLPDLGPHADHILGSYAAMFIIVGGLIAWLTISIRRNRALLERLERQGKPRRGDQRTHDASSPN